MRRRLKKGAARRLEELEEEQSALAGQQGTGRTAVRIKANGCLLGRVWSAKKALKGLNEDRLS